MLKEPVVTKTQSLEARHAYPGGSVFEGSETSEREQSLEGGKGHTHYPAAADDPTSSSVTRGRKTVTVSKDDGATYKTKTKKRRGGSTRKVVSYQTVGGKTIKTTTWYDKDGNKKRSKSKTVKTTKRRTSHRKKDQKLVDAAEVTYTAGGHRGVSGER